MAESRESAVFYDRLSRWGGPVSDADRERIERTLALIPEGTRTILDVGCGDGAVTNSLQERGIKITGVDFSRTALQHFSGSKVTGVIDALPFSDKSFELVICTEVLEHLPDGIYQAAVAELQRVASRWIIVSTPNDEYLPAGLGVCRRCHTRYHVNRHVRTFDHEAHQRLFDDFACTETAAICSWRHDRLMTGIQQRLFNLYAYREHLVCPCCGHEGGAPRPRSWLSRALLKALWLIRKIGPEPTKPRWLASCYLKRGGA